MMRESASPDLGGDIDDVSGLAEPQWLAYGEYRLHRVAEGDYRDEDTGACYEWPPLYVDETVEARLRKLARRIREGRRWVTDCDARAK